MAFGMTNIMTFSKSRYYEVYFWRENLDETSRSPISYCGEGTVSSKQYSTEKKVYFKQRLVESMIKGFLEYTALIITSEEIKSIICRFQRASKE